MLALAGCAASSSPDQPVATAATTGTGTSAASATSPAATGTAPGTTATSTSTASSPTRRRSHSRTTAATVPTGLSATVGFGTYELCQGTCTGSVPSSLRRPLLLPDDDGGPCPVTLHVDGPVAPSTSTEVGFISSIGTQWAAARVTWMASGSYAGPILIRGRQIDGDGAMGFGQGRTPYDELQLLDAGRQAPAMADGGRAWLSSTRITASGCYAYQVDGTDFSEVIVFRAVI
jgi:hypothetical protein